MIAPDRIVEAQRRVASSPGGSSRWCALDDQIGYAVQGEQDTRSYNEIFSVSAKQDSRVQSEMRGAYQSPEQ